MRMSDNREVAKDLLVTAGKTILQDRPGVHGSAENSFQMIADLWSVHLKHLILTRGWKPAQIELRPEDVAEFMSYLKKARKVYGDTLNRDNDVDDLGYTALAGMLRLPDPDAGDMLEDGKPNFNPQDNRWYGDKVEAPPIQRQSNIDDRGTAERMADTEEKVDA